MMTGMSVKQWDNWTLDQKPVALSGRIGRMIEEELLLENVAPIAIEWVLKLPKSKSKGIKISLPAELNLPNGTPVPSIILRGQIDRVDLVPFDLEKNIWIDQEGHEEIAPLDLHNRNNWKPRRLVIIRDNKTTEKTKDKQSHYNGLLE